MIKDPYVLIVVLGIIWGILTELVKYIFKSKNQVEDKTGETLEEIKTLLNNLNLNVTMLKSDLENNIYTTRGIQSQVAGLIEKFFTLNDKVTTLSSQVTNNTKEIDTLKIQILKK